MNLVKAIEGKDLLEIENNINKFIKDYEGELLEFQVFRNDTYNKFEAIISYRQSIPTQK